MPKNFSWSLFLGLHAVMAAVFAAATATMLTWSAEAYAESHPMISACAGLGYLVLTVPVAWSMYAGYTGFLEALQTAWIGMAVPFLMPMGAFIGGAVAVDGFGTDPDVGWVFGASVVSPWAIALVRWCFADGPPHDAYDPDYIRGTRLLSLDQAQRRALALRCKLDEPRIYWAGLCLPERHAAGHFAIIAPTGNGKTVTLRMLMQSVLPGIQPGSGWRALIYDPKSEFLPLLSGMPLSCPVVSLHPYDRRGAAWDIGRDVTDRSIALSLAATLIPCAEGQNKFFYMAAQAILSAVMEAFIVLLPERWTLRDVLLVLQDERVSKRLLLSLPQTRPTHTKYFEQLHGETLGDVYGTLATETTRLEPVAALWDRATFKISLKDWAKDNYILVLGKDKEIDTPLDNVNRVLFQRISQLFTKQGTGRTWIFIDEAKYAGKIPGLDDLLSTGRSFGARVCLATQDLSGFQNAYGTEMAHELLGGTANKALLGTWNPVTAKYAAEIMGKTQRIERTTSRTRGRESSTTEAEHIVDRDAVMPEELMQVLPADDRRFFGYYATQVVGRYAGWIAHEKALYGAGAEPAFLPRSAEEQYLRPWNDADRTRFGPYLADLLMPRATPEAESRTRRTHLDEVQIG